jgi:60 kDa SS-A/Ro ribonucleoprotein
MDARKETAIMANKNLFKAFFGKLLPKADTLNAAGGAAYDFSPKHKLAQYAATGCLNATFYASDAEQLATVLELCKDIDPEFIARTAIFARERGHMKDMPALLCAVLAVRSPGLLCEVFDRVIDNGKMLQNFVQMIRSGTVGRKSLGTAPKRMVRKWFESRDDAAVFRASIGQDPSLADIIKMVHPKPATPSREALYGYLIGREHNAAALPDIVKQYEAFKTGATKTVPHVPFQMLTSLELGQAEWTEIAKNAPWQMTRMNLNTFARHDVFASPSMVKLIAERLRNPVEIARARAFPYQLMTAYLSADIRVPSSIVNALQDAMGLAIKNVPSIAGKLYVCLDVSGSMQSPVTGVRKGSTSVVRCLDVAALVAAALVRKNPEATVVPFSDNVVNCRFNVRDSVLTNAKFLASLPSGGTNCSAPLKMLNQQRALGDLVVYVSDNQSWVETARGQHGSGATATMQEWAKFKSRNPAAKLVCIDLQPYGNTQAKDREDILNVGGFSDQVFEVLGDFAAGRMNQGHWVSTIENVRL